MNRNQWFPDDRYVTHRHQEVFLRRQVLSSDVHHVTCDFSLEGTSSDVVGSSIFDADQVVPRSHGGVLHLVALWNLLTVHLHFGGTLDGHGQGPGARLRVVDDEL